MSVVFLHKSKSQHIHHSLYDEKVILFNCLQTVSIIMFLTHTTWRSLEHPHFKEICIKHIQKVLTRLYTLGINLVNA
jgi:hypothetical protein